MYTLARGFHGEIDYMQRQGNKRSRPALGNTTKDDLIVDALKTKLESTTELVKEHVLWALAQYLKQ
jgi:epoxyqueuosine reductase QueG